MEEKSDDATSWVNRAGDILTVQVSTTIPALNTGLNDLQGVRAFCQQSARSQGAELVEANVVQIDGTAAIKTITRRSLTPRADVYIGTLLVPFADRALLIKIQSLEIGTARRRRVKVQQTLRQTGTHASAPGNRRSPQPRGDHSTPPTDIRAMADDPRFDQAFPEHPLSKIRKYLRVLIKQTRFTPAVHRWPRFTPAPPPAGTPPATAAKTARPPSSAPRPASPATAPLELLTTAYVPHGDTPPLTEVVPLSRWRKVLIGVTLLTPPVLAALAHGVLGTSAGDIAFFAALIATMALLLWIFLTDIAALLLVAAAAMLLVAGVIRLFH